MKNIDFIFQKEEGNILMFGIFLIFLLIIFIIVSYQIDAGYAHKISGMVFSNLFIGRVPSLSLGYAAKLSHLSVIGTNVIIELILVTILYPLFVYSVRGMLKIKMLEEFFENVQEKRKLHQKKFDKYGKWGLFIFVFIPFWMTGPIVGAMIGYLIGIKHYTTIVIVTVATTVAITLWGLFLQEIIDVLLILDTQIVWIILFIIVFGILIYRFRNIIKNFLNQK